jgi:hypothetical protein
LLPGQQVKSFKITLSANGNHENDIYTNEFSTRAKVIEVDGTYSLLNTLSNDVSVRVYAGSLGGIVWGDSNGNGIIEATETRLGNKTVCLIGTGMAGYGDNVDPLKLDPGIDGIFGTADDQELCVQTNALGEYLFNNLQSGVEYQVTVNTTNITGAETYDLDGIATASVSLHTLLEPIDRNNNRYIECKLWIPTKPRIVRACILSTNNSSNRRSNNNI